MKRRDLLQRAAALLGTAAALPAAVALAGEPETNEPTGIGAAPRFAEDWTAPYRTREYGLSFEIDRSLIKDDIYGMQRHFAQAQWIDLFGAKP